MVREHGWSPVSLVSGREPRIFGELVHNGNPASYHLQVGDGEGDVAERMRFRYHAKLEIIKSQARSMLLKTVLQRTRRISNPTIGQLVFFWRKERSKSRTSQSRWVGPGYIVGLQDGNAWVTCGGRCFLVAGEHLREAVGDESHFGDPEVQKALALFKKIPKEIDYENLIDQEGPRDDEMQVEENPLAQDVAEDIDMPQDETRGLPNRYQRLVKNIGWNIDDVVNPVLVSNITWSYRTPEPKYDGSRYPFCTTWGFMNGVWKRLGNEVKWGEPEDPHAAIPDGPAGGLVTMFMGRVRKEVVLDDVPSALKRPKTREDSNPVCSVFPGKTESKAKLRRMIEKEIPYEKIPPKDVEMYLQAEQNEWDSWKQFESCEVLSPEQSEEVLRTKPDRVLPSRFVYRNKHAGLVDTKGVPLPVKAKARLCLQGHLCPDSMSGQLQVDSPTVERVSTMIFLHHVVSSGLLDNWYIGDISNAFLQGAPLKGCQEMFMRQPKQGLSGLLPGQILRLIKSVYGRPDAPRAWFDELSRILREELEFTQCLADPALFALRSEAGCLCGLLLVHVDDIMICHDGSEYGRAITDRLNRRFPFGTWQNVAEQASGVSYCGKEIKVDRRDGERVIVLAQNCFIDGRLQPIEISGSRKKEKQAPATEAERTDLRSLVGSLQWLITQTRPDLAFEVNQLQKRISDLKVSDLIRANKAVQEVLDNRMELIFRDLGQDAEVVAFHDAGLYNSVGVELQDREVDDLLLDGSEKRLVYSQKGAVIGLVRKGDTNHQGRVHMNVLDWKSCTNKRVIESSFAAETHGALMAHNMARFSQVLLSEVRFGSGVMSAIEDDGWQSLVPVTMVTDCKSIFDTIHKDGRHVSEKGNIVHAVLLRQLMTTRSSESKATLLWVRTRCQLADGLTKGGRASDLRKLLREGLLFHELAAPKRKACSDQREGLISAKIASAC